MFSPCSTNSKLAVQVHLLYNASPSVYLVPPLLSLLTQLSHHDALRYLDDLPDVEEELYAGLVLSEHAHASITVNASAALAMEGVVDYVCVSDVPGSNMVGER